MDTRFDIAHLLKHARHGNRYTADGTKRLAFANVGDFIPHKLDDVVDANALWIFAVFDHGVDRKAYSLLIFRVGLSSHFLPPLQFYLRENGSDFALASHFFVQVVPSLGLGTTRPDRFLSFCRSSSCRILI